jgi:hypothetical protein
MEKEGERAAAGHVDELDAAGTSCREGREWRSEDIALPHTAGERRGSSPPARAT